MLKNRIKFLYDSIPHKQFTSSARTKHPPFRHKTKLFSYARLRKSDKEEISLCPTDFLRYM